MDTESAWEQVAAAAADGRPADAREALAPLLADPAWAPLARVVEVGVEWDRPWPDSVIEALALEVAGGGPLAEPARTQLVWAVASRSLEQRSDLVAGLREVAARHALNPVDLWLESPSLLGNVMDEGVVLASPELAADDRLPETVARWSRSVPAFVTPPALAPGGSWWGVGRPPRAREVARELAWMDFVLPVVVERQRAGDDAGAVAAVDRALGEWGEDGAPAFAWMVTGQWERVADDDDTFGASVRWARAAPDERVPALVADAAPDALRYLARSLAPEDPAVASALEALAAAPPPARPWRPADAPGRDVVLRWDGGDRSALELAKRTLDRAPDGARTGWARWIAAEAARAEGRERAARRQLRAGLRGTTDPWRPLLAWSLYESTPRDAWLWAAWPLVGQRIDPAEAIGWAERSNDPFAAGSVARFFVHRPHPPQLDEWIEQHLDDPLADDASARFVRGFHDIGTASFRCDAVQDWWDVWVAVQPHPRPWIVAVSTRGDEVADELEACAKAAVRRGEPLPHTVTLEERGAGWAEPADGATSPALAACLSAVGVRAGVDHWRVHFATSAVAADPLGR